jgi:hypothetical protein
MKRYIAIATIAAAAIAITGCTNPQVQQAVTDGQLFCKQVTATGSLIKKVATTSGAPVSVIGQSSAQVKAWCALIDAVPVPPPAAPEQAPVAPVVPTA